MLSKPHNIKKSAAWATIGTGSQILSQLIAIVVLARLLTPAEFGVVSAATLVTQLSLIFSELGVGPYIVQRTDLTPDKINTAFAMSLGLGVLIALLLYVSAPLIAEALHVGELKQVLRVYAVVFVISGIAAVPDALTQRDLDFKYLARADAISFSVGYTAVSILCAYLGFSFWSIVAGHLTQAIIRGGIVISRHPKVMSGQVSSIEARQIAAFGMGQTLSRLSSFVGDQADGFIVTASLGVNAIGHYGRANQLVTMPSAQLGQIFDRLIFPTVARMQGEQVRAAAAYRTAITIICMLSFPLSALFWILSDKIVQVALGSQWGAVVEPMQVLALAVPFRLIHKVSDPTARALGSTYSRAWRHWLAALCVITSTIIFSRYGLAAIAWGVVTATALDAILMMALCCSLTRLSHIDLLRAFIPGFRIGGATVLVALLVGKAIHPWQNNAFLMLLATGAASVGCIILLARKYRLR